MEINEIRPFFAKAMNIMGRIKAEAIPDHLSRQEIQYEEF